VNASIFLRCIPLNSTVASIKLPCFFSNINYQTSFRNSRLIVASSASCEESVRLSAVLLSGPILQIKGTILGRAMIVWHPWKTVHLKFVMRGNPRYTQMASNLIRQKGHSLKKKNGTYFHSLIVLYLTESILTLVFTGTTITSNCNFAMLSVWCVSTLPNRIHPYISFLQGLLSLRIAILQFCLSVWCVSYISRLMQHW
jgi:hypothetical protein